MINKKILSGLLGIILFLIIPITIIAQDTVDTRVGDFSGSSGSWSVSIGEFIDKALDSISPVLKLFFGIDANGEMFFAKLLIFIIILSIIYIALEKVEFFHSTNWAHWVVSIAVSLLGVRFLTEDLVGTIILPNAALAIAITAGIPFVIYFIVVNIGLKDQYPAIRRLAWVFFAVIFIGLHFSRAGSIENGGWIYLVTAILALIMIIFDGTISRFFKRLRVERNLSNADYLEYNRLLKRRDEVQDAMLESQKAGDTTRSQQLGKQLGRINIRLLQLGYS